MLRVIYSQLVNVGSVVGKGWVGGLGMYGCVFANIKRVVENYNTPGLSEAAFCFSKKVADTGWVPRFRSPFWRLGGVNHEVGRRCCLVRPASSEEEEPLLARSMLTGQEDPMLLGSLLCKGPNPVSKGSNHLLIPSHQPLGITTWVLEKEHSNQSFGFYWYFKLF